MKQWMKCIIALALSLMLVTSAMAETVSDSLYTMSEKLVNQLEAGSGFTGTLTLTATAVEGREQEAFVTTKPITLNWTYIQVVSNGAAEEVRMTIAQEDSDYQQGSAEISIQDNTVYLQSTLLGDGWYLLGEDLLGSSDDTEISAELLDVSSLLPSTDISSGIGSFVSEIAVYLINGTSEDISDALEPYTTKIDFWLEGYLESMETSNLEDGTSTIVSEYSIPASAIKAQLKQLLVDLMDDETLLAALQTLMPEEQVELYLDPSLEPYYFYAVDELALTDALTIRRVMSFAGETIELSVTMPFVDSELGDMTLVYSRVESGEDTSCEYTLSLTSETVLFEVSYNTYETITGTTVYQGSAVLEYLETADAGETDETITEITDETAIEETDTQEEIETAEETADAENEAEVADETADAAETDSEADIDVETDETAIEETDTQEETETAEETADAENEAEVAEETADVVETDADVETDEVAIEETDTQEETETAEETADAENEAEVAEETADAAVTDADTQEAEAAAEDTSVQSAVAVSETTPQSIRIDFSVTTSSTTTKDLNGYETLNQSLTLSVAPTELAEGEDEAEYLDFAAVDISLNISYASLSGTSSPTEVNIALEVSGEDMAQVITLEINGETTSLWTPEEFDEEEAIVIAEMSEDDLSALLSQATIKAGLIFLPYVSLPDSWLNNSQ